MKLRVLARFAINGWLFVQFDCLSIMTKGCSPHDFGWQNSTGLLRSRDNQNFAYYNRYYNVHSHKEILSPSPYVISLLFMGRMMVQFKM